MLLIYPDKTLSGNNSIAVFCDLTKKNQKIIISFLLLLLFRYIKIK
jgi:hypothetical protein